MYQLERVLSSKVQLEESADRVLSEGLPIRVRQMLDAQEHGIDHLHLWPREALLELTSLVHRAWRLCVRDQTTACSMLQQPPSFLRALRNTPEWALLEEESKAPTPEEVANAARTRAIQILSMPSTHPEVIAAQASLIRHQMSLEDRRADRETKSEVALHIEGLRMERERMRSEAQAGRHREYLDALRDRVERQREAAMEKTRLGHALRREASREASREKERATLLVEQRRAQHKIEQIEATRDARLAVEGAVVDGKMQIIAMKDEIEKRDQKPPAPAKRSIGGGHDGVRDDD